MDDRMPPRPHGTNTFAPTAAGPPPDSLPGVWRRAGWRIIPICALAYVLSYMDRVNLGYISAPLAQDLGMNSTQIGLAAGLFFLGYILFEVPSNMALRRFGARRWIARILVSWGIVTALTATVDSVWLLYVARVVLGIAEAGLAAGLVLYLSTWFPHRQRAWVLSLFFLSLPVSAIIGAPFAALLLTWGHSLIGVAGWRAVFLAEGVLTVLVGIAVLAVLPDTPFRARWLTPDQARYIVSVLDAEAAESGRERLTTAGQALTSRSVWAMGAAFFALLFGLYPVSFFLPSMISRAVTGVGAGTAQLDGVLLSIVPNAVGIVAMVAWPKAAGRLNALACTLIPWVAGAAGLAVVALSDNLAVSLVAISVSVAGVYAAIPQFWRVPALGLSGAASAAGIALINSVGNSSGFVGPYLTGALKTATGGYAAALWLIAAVMLAGAAGLAVSARRARPAGSPVR
ncbi:MAG TPA: MFS transporter [Trebonia sp.]